MKDQKENYEGHLNREDTNPYNDRSIHQEKKKESSDRNIHKSQFVQIYKGNDYHYHITIYAGFFHIQ